MVGVVDLWTNDAVDISLGVNPSIVYDYISKKIANGRYFLDLDDFYNDLPILSKRTIGRCIEQLVLAGNIIKVPLTSLDKFKIISAKKMNGLGIGNRICEWCGYKSTVIHRHHYPISRRDKGTEIVNICANCHCEFHHLTSELIIQEVI